MISKRTARRALQAGQAVTCEEGGTSSTGTVAEDNTPYRD